MSLYERIPNNVNLSNDKRLLRALEHWLPNYMQWWMDMGPEGFQADDVYLRTAVSVETAVRKYTSSAWNPSGPMSIHHCM